MEWSQYQRDFFADTKSGEGNTCLESVAGSGKSTSLVEALKHLPAKGKSGVLVTSFSVACCDDLRAKNPPYYADVKTLNSLGYQACLRRFGKLEVKKNRLWEVLDKIFGEPPKHNGDLRSAFFALKSNVKKATDLAKNYLLEDPEAIVELAGQFDCGTTVPEFMKNGLAAQLKCGSEDIFGKLVVAALNACKKVEGAIDFNDQIWLPNVFKLELPQHARLFIDEVQDTCPAQLGLIRRAIRKDGRACGIGDRSQALYAFRGAGLGTQPFIDMFKARTLPLSISYRCPKATIALAKVIVPHIEAHSNAIEGSVDQISRELLMDTVAPGDVILSRSNAPLVRLFFEFLRAGVTCGVNGSDLGEGLKDFVVKSGCKGVKELLDYTQEWQRVEIDKRKAKNENARVDHIEDKAAAIRILCEKQLTITDVYANIQRLLFAGESAVGKVLLSSVHRAKGLEWDRVLMLKDTFAVTPEYWIKYAKNPGSAQAQAWAMKRAEETKEKDQEACNIYYVAVTRARQELIMVV